MWHSRVFWRQVGIYGLLVLASSGLLGAILAAQAERQRLGQIDDSLRDKAVLVEDAFSQVAPGQLASLQERLIALRQRLGTRITLIDGAGAVLADSDGDPALLDNHANRPEVVQARAGGVGLETRYSDTTHENMRYVARRVAHPTGPVQVVRVARPLSSIEAEVGDLRRTVWLIALATAAAGVLLTFILTRKLTRPLEELTSAAQRIAAGDFGSRVYVSGADEVGVMAQAFNTMSVQLAAQFAQVEEDRRQLRTVLGGMVEGVVAVDADQRILFVNDRAGQLLEIATPHVVGRKLWEAVRQPAIHDLVQRTLAGGTVHEEQLEWAGPGAKHLAVHVAPLTGSPTGGAVLVVHDTSNLRRLERLREEFVANVSHELKTPLSVIKVCVETLLDGAVDDLEHRGAFLEQIDEQTDRLHMLILDLLSLARLESGEETFQREAVALQPVIQACVERHRARAEAKELVLEADTAADAGAAWADEDAVNHILDNLVDNALKYTPAGGRIEVRCRPERTHLCLEVSDTGIGIPERDLPRVFERFYRVDKARSRELGGTGLGLSIVKHLAQAMQGTVRAISQPGHGSTFVVHLPKAEPA